MIDHWTKDKIAAARPRDLVVDPSGAAFVKDALDSEVPPADTFGGLTAIRPYGALNIEEAAQQKTPLSAGVDLTAPAISTVSPQQGETIPATHTFTAKVSDPSGVKKVRFVIKKDGYKWNFKPSYMGGDTWSLTLTGFSDGEWKFFVRVQDMVSPGGGNNAATTDIAFMVDTTPPPPPPSTPPAPPPSTTPPPPPSNTPDVVVNDPWTGGGAVQTAAGRIYFEMPDGTGGWNGYVCSGTVGTDAGDNDRSVIVTAAHCIYDDINKAFARNVLFIPNQAGTSGQGTDFDCFNDPLGCWAPGFGVVDADWTVRSFPNNIPWDYGFYVVETEGAHLGADAGSDSLEVAAGSLAVSFAPPAHDDPTGMGSEEADYSRALGYSYAHDPDFMFCAQDMTLYSSSNWWLADCGLSGGASGGPWLQPATAAPATNAIFSVNSWGFVSAPGMAGPRFDVGFAQGVWHVATCADLALGDEQDGKQGVAVSPTTTCP